tara:strand:+ start:111 stop:497 length:387 start_codon:yes stop_codon:yes gene_type:complete
MAGGRPPIFKDKQELQSCIDEYLTNPPVKVVVTKDGPIEVPAVTITGLALHLGFESRQSLHDYEKRDEFSYIIKRARLEVENSYEFQLQHGNSTGAIFALKNMSWTDKTQTENLNVDMTHEQWLDGLK